MAETTDEYAPHGEGTLGEEGRSAREADPEEIRAEIRETRERMGDNLEQLGERLNPSHLKEQVKQDIRDATIGKVENMAQKASDQMDEARQTIGEARNTITETVRENPIPAAMVGIGLGWLIYNTRKQSSTGRLRSGWSSARARSGGYRGGYAGAPYETRPMSGTTPGGESFGESGTIDRVRAQASELAEDAEGKAGEIAGLAQNVATKTRRQAHRAEDEFYENPLAVGAAALALGMAAGLTIPGTRKEQELMGEARDRLAHKVRDVAGETKDKVEHVAERVADQAKSTAKKAAREEGLTAS
ncbi:MAG TPA: DUF3618 domain-containing protein [Gemmatimonadaceae bacterium]|jgi:Protein of unknown function (DUF3618).